MRTGSPSPLLLALAALALPARADVIRQTDGKTLTDVSVSEETLTLVTYKQGNSTKTIPSEEVQGVEYERYPRKVDEAEAAYASGDLAGAVDLFLDYARAEAEDPKERRKWAPPYAAWRAVDIRQELADTQGVVAAADLLIQGYPESRYVPAAYLAKAAAQQQMQAVEKALDTLTSFEQLIDTKGLSKRWRLECKLGKLQADPNQVGDAKRAQISSILADAKDFPSVVSRAKVVEGETYLEDAEKDQGKAGEYRRKAQEIFDHIVEDPSADAATLAGAHLGLGDCHFYGANGDADVVRKALMHYLRVIVLYESQTRYVPKALFFAMRCFDLLDDPQRRHDMLTTLRSRYPASYWASEAEKFRSR